MMDVVARAKIARLKKSVDKLGLIIDIDSWESVQYLVRAGVAAQHFNVGDQLVSSYDTGTITWDVIGIDHDVPTASQFQHSLTLQMHDCLMNAQFDAPEALYYAEVELAAGEHIFTLNSLKYKFTTAQAVPAGGQVFVSAWDGDTYVPTKITTYAADRTTAIESNLNVAAGTGSDTLTPVNHHQRCRYGSNNYLESALRAWLNSAEASFAWTPKTNFDRPPTAAPYTGAGFLSLLDPELVAVLGAVDKQVARNTVTDGGGQDLFSDKIFLISRVEAYGGTEGVATGETPYSYYSAMAEAPTANAIAGRIKLLSAAPRYWWLRSPHPGNAYYVRGVSLAGEVGYISAGSSFGVAPACCIV